VPQPFHFAFFVRDLTSTRPFYGEVLGCREGRSTDTWVEYPGQPGEQATMFLLDPGGNALEFKSFKHPEHVFIA
jgi:extradiol dioxygenase family protein